MTSCPLPDALGRLLAGALPPRAAEVVRRHLAGCPDCQGTAGRFDDDTDLRRLLPADPALLRPIRVQGPLAAVMARLRGRDGKPAPASPPARGATAAVPLGPPADRGELGTLGPYRVQAELGRGGAGVVLRGYDASVRRTVALRVPRAEAADEAARERLVRDSRLAAGLRHDHLVGVYAVLEPPGALPCVVMELVPGPSLAARVRARPPLPHAEAARLVAEAAEGLACAHAAGLVHGDVKPSAVLIDSRTQRARLGDFGLALGVERGKALAREGALVGGPAHLSPEQARGQPADARSDVYGLAATLYEALTGEAPFRGSYHMVLRQVLEEEPPPPRRVQEAVPAELEAVCLKGLAKDPGRRYRSAAEMAADLRRWLAGEAVGARPPRRPLPFAGLARWRPGRAGGRLAAVLAVAAVAAYGSLFWQLRRAAVVARAALVRSAAAEARCAEAEEDFRLAQDAVRRCAAHVRQERLLDEPPFQPLRQELLRTAREFCQAFVRNRRGRPRAAAALSQAMVDLAGLLGPADALPLLQEAIDLLEGLRRQEPDNDDHRRRLGGAYNQLGNFHQNAGQLDKALAAYQKALQAAGKGEGETRADPGRQEEVARAHLHLGVVYSLTGRDREAEEELQKARAVAGRLVEEGAGLPQTGRTEGLCENTLAEVYRRQGQTDKGLAAARRALAVWERLGKKDPQRVLYQEEQVRSLIGLGYTYQALADAPKAEESFRGAVAVLGPLARGNPLLHHLQWWLPDVHLSLGRSRHYQGRFREALAAYEEGARLAGDLLRARPKDPMAALIELLALRDQGVLRLDQGEAAAAVSLFDRAIDRLNACAEARQRVPALRSAAPLLHQYRALALSELGRHDEADADCAKALALAEEGRGPLLLCVRALLRARRPGGADPAAVYRQQYARAVALLDPRAAGLLDASSSHLAACVCALAGAACAANDPAQADRLAGWAVTYLARAEKAGYFLAPGRLARLARAKDLDPLRGRADFRKWLAGVAGKDEAGPKAR
jgi:tetratricopeptide (TPR) repeat protein